MDIPDLDLDDFVDFLNNGRELDPDESATLKTLFSGRLDSPLPSISSRQGSALQTGEQACNLHFHPGSCCKSCASTVARMESRKQMCQRLLYGYAEDDLAPAGFSYGRLLHSRGSGSGGMGNSRPSSGLDNMSTLEEAMNGGTSKRE